MSAETTELLESLRRARVISDTDCERFDNSSSIEIAARLKSDGIINPFQADRIIAHQRVVVGDYVLRRPIGQGGMGTLFEAWHPHLDRIVVLKSVADHLPRQDELRRRFERELQICGQLSHPNIVTVHDAVIENGVPWLVMERLEGRDLGSVVASQAKLSEHEAVAVSIQAARGLAYAHERGILHRDVKPSNLFLVGGSTVRVLDFGLAWAREATAAEHQLVTSPGVALGTAAFMSPEQAINSHAADVRSDIYSLGCTLYYLLTGDVPYRGRTPVEQILAHREQQVPELTDAAIGTDVRGVLRRMMAKDPERRPQSMDEVVDSLIRVGGKPASELSVDLASLSTLPALPNSVEGGRADREVNRPRIGKHHAGWLLGLAAIFLFTVIWFSIPPTDSTTPPIVPAGAGGGAASEDEWSAVVASLEAVNPGVTIPKHAYTKSGGSATVDLTGISELRTLVPLKGLPVDSLYVSGTGISGLMPLEGSQLRSIDIGETGVTDISPLGEMELEEFAAYASPLHDLEPLRGMNPWRVDIHQSDVEDLSPLQGMRLEELDMHETKVRDLSPLANSPLGWLDCRFAPISSLDPIRSCPLERLWCDPELLRGIDIEKTWPDLEQINDLNTDQWLTQHTER